MIFDDHSKLKGTHAILSPSNHSWVRYDRDKLREVILNRMATEHGTRLHNLASELIQIGDYKLERKKKTLNMFVNDAISYHMESEKVLYYSDNCYGTTDAISYNEKKRLLRIFDLKTGQTPASMEQLEIYAALFCLSKGLDPSDIEIELRIYQFNEIYTEIPEDDTIRFIMDQIVYLDKEIEILKAEV